MPEPLELPEATLQQANKTGINYDNTDDILAENSLPKTDMDYAFQIKQSVNSMNWKGYNNNGKKDGYFSIYTSPASLNRVFYKKK